MKKTELQTIPFGSLLKAKKKLSKAQKLQEGSDSDEEDEDENGPGGKNRKGKTEFGVKVKRGSNGRPLKKDRSSKHALVLFFFFSFLLFGKAVTRNGG